jgi:O-antigen ligase
MFLTNFELGLFEFDSTDHLHNSYLTLIFESGIIVFIVYIFAIIEQFLNLPQKNRNIFIYILYTFLIASFFVEFRLGGLRFFNFFFVAIIGYIISTRSVRLQKVELKKTT